MKEPENMQPSNQFELGTWLSSLLFPDAGSVKASCPGSEIGQHLPRHRIECPICGRSLKDVSDVTEIGPVSGRER